MTPHAVGYSQAVITDIYVFVLNNKIFIFIFLYLINLRYIFKDVCKFKFSVFYLSREMVIFFGQNSEHSYSEVFEIKNLISDFQRAANQM